MQQDSTGRLHGVAAGQQALVFHKLIPGGSGESREAETTLIVSDASVCCAFRLRNTPNSISTTLLLHIDEAGQLIIFQSLEQMMLTQKGLRASGH